MAGGANHHVYHCAFGVTDMDGQCGLRAREAILRVIRPEIARAVNLWSLMQRRSGTTTFAGRQQPPLIRKGRA